MFLPLEIAKHTQCALGSQTPSPSKAPPSLFLAKSPLNQQAVQAPLFRQSPPLAILVFRDPPPPWIFQRTPKIFTLNKFFILNTVLSFKSKLFLSLNISDFNFLCVCENCAPLHKLTPSSPATPLSKLRSCQIGKAICPTCDVKNANSVSSVSDKLTTLGLFFDENKD